MSHSREVNVKGFSRKNGIKAENDSACVFADHQKMTNFLKSQQIPVFESILGQKHTRQAKKDILDVIEKFIFQSKKSRFVIYYSGLGGTGSDGTECGDWLLNENDTTGEALIISLSDILEIWDKMRVKNRSDELTYDNRDLLFIIADCCHSGGWVDYLKQYRKPIKDPNGKDYRDVHMIASCGKFELCDATESGSVFTDHYVNSDSSTHNLVDTGAHRAKLVVQSAFQAATFPVYMPVKGLVNMYNAQKKYSFKPFATNDESGYRIFLMKHDGIKLPIGNGLGLNSGWSWMLSGQVFHN